MTAPAEDPRRVAAKRFGKLYEKGITETVTELADVFLKKLPWKWLVFVVVAGGASLLKFMVVPYLTSLAVQDWSERRGVRLEVGGWHADLWDLRVRATGLELKGADKFSRANLLEASAIELDFGARYHLSQYFWLKPLWDLLRLDLSAYGLSKVELDHAVVHIERRMSGHGNWDTTLARLDLGLGEAKPGSKLPSGVQPVAVTEETCRAVALAELQAQERRDQAAQDRMDRESARRLGRRPHPQRPGDALHRRRRRRGAQSVRRPGRRAAAGGVQPRGPDGGRTALDHRRVDAGQRDGAVVPHRARERRRQRLCAHGAGSGAGTGVRLDERQRRALARRRRMALPGRV